MGLALVRRILWPIICQSIITAGALIVARYYRVDSSVGESKSEKSTSGRSGRAKAFRNRPLSRLELRQAPLTAHTRTDFATESCKFSATHSSAQPTSLFNGVCWVKRVAKFNVHIVFCN